MQNARFAKKPIGHTGLPLFWTVKIERHGILMNAVKRQDGLTALLGGNPYIASVMGADEEMTQSMTGEVKITVCETCALEPHSLFSLLGE